MSDSIDSKVMVTICCLAYNHEKYIGQCLEGFIMQKTNFAYEVIVHDDNSTDNTKNIILDYAKKYPNIIKPILEEKNKFSDFGISGIYRSILYPLAKGKYFAYCEGDDFWSSADKLQKQVDILENNPECHLCVHFARVTSEDGKAMNWGYPQKLLKTGLMDGQEFMKGLTDGYFFHTTSFMCRKNDIMQMIDPIPEYYLLSDVDDVPLLLYMGNLGSVFYLDEELTCYRRESIGSWTEGQKGNIEKIIAHKWRMIEMYKKYDEFTLGKYKELVNHWINNERFMIAEYEHDFKEMSKFQYREFMKNRSWKFKMKVLCRGKF